jgi:hypothetical protein
MSSQQVVNFVRLKARSSNKSAKCCVITAWHQKVPAVATLGSIAPIAISLILDVLVLAATT